MSNPYSGAHFFDFVLIFLKRLFFPKDLFIHMAADELQFFVLAIMAISSALIGAFLVLRKMTMLANALSHTSLIGIVVGYLIFANHFMTPLMFIIASLVTALITAILIEFLTKVMKLQEDASIGLVFTTLFAFGIILVTAFAKNSHLGTELIMGNVDSLQKSDLSLVFSMMAINAFFIIVFFKELKVATFDPFLAASFGFSPTIFKIALTLLTAGTTICAFRAVGVLMVLAFLTGPVVIARCFTHSLSKLLIYSSLVGVLASFCSVALSRHILSSFGVGLSTGGLTVCLLVVFYLFSLFFSKYRKRKLA